MKMRIKEIGPKDMFHNNLELIGCIGDWEPETSNGVWESGTIDLDHPPGILRVIYFIQVKVSSLDIKPGKIFTAGPERAIEEWMDIMETATSEEYIGPYETLSEYSRTVKEEPIHRHGHPDFYRLCEEEMDLHSRKNHDYAAGGNPLGNFNRVSAILAMYPGLKLSDPAVVAITYMMKQLDASLWMLSNGHVAQVEGQKERWQDISVYSKIISILISEGGKNVKDN